MSEIYNLLRDWDMGLVDGGGVVLVTGACGHVGNELCRVLRAAGKNVLAVDVDSGSERTVAACDIRSKNDLARLFQEHLVSSVVHLAGVLPSAFDADPLLGAEVNIEASVELMRQSAAAKVQRFLFASSMSVYGTGPSRQPLTEEDATAPEDPYGGAKRAIELIGEGMGKNKAFEFAALRIARVVGPGIKKTSSPWRAQIFEKASRQDSICLPFSPKAMLSILHAREVAQMFLTLVQATRTTCPIYNAPAETWEVQQLKQAVEELRGVQVRIGPEPAHGGPLCDGRRFAKEFGFELRGLREYLAQST